MTTTSETQGTTIISPDDDSCHLESFDALRDQIRFVTTGVAENYQVGVYLLGRPGTGKSFTVLETLKALDVPHYYCNSRMSAMGLWHVLKDHPEHVVVIDDIPSLIKDRQAVQIFQATLDGRPGTPRPVGYHTKDSRSDSFEFSGGIIAISNLPLGL